MCKGYKQTFFPDKISSIVPAQMNEATEAFLGQTVIATTTTVPAYFNDNQRQATRDTETSKG